jgi:uncharacterized membrane protein YjjP (DUF1212 family)
MKILSHNCIGVKINDPTHPIVEVDVIPIIANQPAETENVKNEPKAKARAHGMPVVTTQNPATPMVVAMKVTNPVIVTNCASDGRYELRKINTEIKLITPIIIEKSLSPIIRHL